MIQIIQIMHLASSDFDNFVSFVLTLDETTLETLQEDWTLGHAQSLNTNEGLFLVLKKGKAIGFGSITHSPNAASTSSIALVNHCHIIPTEQQKGYGNQLFRHLRQFAQVHFDFLQLKKTCPLQQRMGEMIDLSIL